MSLDTFSITSEAPHALAQEIRLALDALDLPAGRLSEADLTRVVLAITSRPELFTDLIVDDRESRWWLLLQRTANFEVKLLTWEQDQSSDWHDHSGSSGAFAVTSGRLQEQRRAADLVSVASRTLGPGQHATFGPNHIHDVDYLSGEPAVSIHAYSPPLTSLTFYDRTDFGFVAREVIPEETRSLQRTTQPVLED
jgi:mannose-6-phosphate isomerase-like protein (cupin superfamily)